MVKTLEAELTPVAGLGGKADARPTPNETQNYVKIITFKEIPKTMTISG